MSTQLQINAIPEDLALKNILTAMAADNAALRASIVGITAKLDVYATAGTDYASLWNPPTPTVIA